MKWRETEEGSKERDGMSGKVTGTAGMEGERQEKLKRAKREKRSEKKRGRVRQRKLTKTSETLKAHPKLSRHFPKH